MAAKSQGNGTVTVHSPSAFQMLRKRMEELATLDSTEKVTDERAINAILNAEDEADMWDADELSVFNAQKLSGCALQLRSFSVKYGNARGGDNQITTPFVTDKGQQMYLLVEAVMLDNDGTHKKEIRLPEVGEVFTWNTSAVNIVGKLFWMLNHGWFDLSNEKLILVRIEGTKTQSGNSVEKLKEYKDANHARAVIQAVAEEADQGTLDGDEPPF